MDKLERMKELNEITRKASEAYYLYDNPIMSDKQYDDLYDELESLEKELGIILATSVTQKVQGGTLDGFKKVRHTRPMLSSNKTKDINEIKRFIGNRSVMGSYKEDGCTLVLRYNGNMQTAITRGTDGIIGEDVTESAKFIENLPLKIPFDGELEIRGECVISWDSFNEINEGLETPYSHPRNLASASLRTLDTNITRTRHLRFVAFELVFAEGKDFKYRNQTLNWLDTLGFETVERVSITNEVDSPCFENSYITNDVDYFISEFTADKSKYPVDGLIFNFENLEYAKSLGCTSKFPLDMIALKWQNDTYETILREVEWNTSRTGRINPRARYDKVIIEGSELTYATLNNLSFIEELELGIGDTITVYKSNQIIPTIDDNLTRSNTIKAPEYCPCCHGKTEIRNENGSKTVWCTNPNCEAKILSKLEYFVSKRCINIDGLSRATIELLNSLGYVNSYIDFYKLDQTDFMERKIDGMAKKSKTALIKAIDDSRHTSLDKFICALGIEGVGRTAAKDIANKIINDAIEHMFGGFEYGDLNGYFMDIVTYNIGNKGKQYYSSIEGIGDKTAENIVNFFSDEVTWNMVNELVSEFTFEFDDKSDNDNDNGTGVLSGMCFCQTGKLSIIPKRDMFIDMVISNGGQYSDKINKSVTHLVCADINGSSTKLTKARANGVELITEQTFLNLIGQ